jgi:photosynthetic reaction center cytochrome c subunit
MRRTIVVLALLVLALSTHAEQKNVKLLTNLTDAELQRTMNLMRASLGTHCDYCHVIQKEWDFASDDKPAKTRAREMIRMVMEINRATFAGQAVVSCYTCHRGAVHPVSLVALPQAAPPFPTPVPEKPVLPEAKTIVAKYAAALGNVARLESRILTGERTGSDGTAPIEIREKGAKVRVVAHLPKQNTEQTFDGTKGWMKNGEEVRPMPPRAEENFKAMAAAFAPVLPAEIGDDARTIATEKISDRDAWVVERALPNGARRRFYFDASSGLLVRTVSLVPRPIGTIPQQTDYEDYRDAGGTQFPFRVRVSLVDPWTGATRQYSSVQLGATIEDGVFAMP